MDSVRRWWIMGFAALAVGSAFVLGNGRTWAGSDEVGQESPATQDSRMKDDDAAKPESAPPADTVKDDTSASDEKDQ